MIRVETHIFDKRGVVAVAFVASSEEDLHTLDFLHSIFSDKKDISLGYATSNRLILHVSGLPSHIFNAEKNNEKT